MERQIRYFEEQLTKFEIPKATPESATTFLRGMDQQQEFEPRTAASALEGLERVLGAREKELLDLNRMHQQLAIQHNEKIEHLQVLAKTLQFYTEHEIDFDENDDEYGGGNGRGMNTVPKGMEGRLGGGRKDNANKEMGSVKSSSRGDRDGGAGGYQSSMAEQMKFQLMTGVLDEEQRPRFERMVK